MHVMGYLINICQRKGCGKPCELQYSTKHVESCGLPQIVNILRD